MAGINWTFVGRPAPSKHSRVGSAMGRYLHVPILSNENGVLCVSQDQAAIQLTHNADLVRNDEPSVGDLSTPWKSEGGSVLAPASSLCWHLSA